MASSSSATAAANLAAALGSPPTEKLTRQNHLFWKTQVLPALRGAQVLGLLDGSDAAPSKTLEVEDSEKQKSTVPNEAYAVWLARDQTVLSYLVKGLDVDLLSHVVGLESAHQVWTTIEGLFASQSRSRVNMLRGALANTKKLELTVPQFISKMRGFASELAAAGKIVDDDELKGYILGGLQGPYTPFVASMNATPNTTLTDIHLQMSLLVGVIRLVQTSHAVMVADTEMMVVIGMVATGTAVTTTVVMTVEEDTAIVEMIAETGDVMIVTVATMTVATTGVMIAVMFSAVMVEVVAAAVMTVVHPREDVVEAGLPHGLLILHAKSAPSMVTLQVSVGGATLTVMMMMMIAAMTVTVLRKEPMASIQIGTWTLAPLIILLGS
ncbi:hypothetical protein QYE76_012736 [Lolium multiflorum]|uniref:Retrotransposon Copia-like N-terminal domain-containing protein n=1 Tax=Lolium multiflorum TaxID=4521 RepID=A0AAD8U1I0_LOLMU|nr:hypothetical protein QYE76_012736 [Lolium multiflorum]